MIHSSEVKEVGTARDEMRARIIAAATALLSQGGRDAVTTRAVAAGAQVQAPAIYRIFGDKNGLLEAVAEHGYKAYLGEKRARAASDDPLEDLRAGWDLHIGFGLSNPAIYSLIYGDPRAGAMARAAAVGYQFLESHIHRLAVAGRLRFGEVRAAKLVHASGCGTVLTLLATPADERDLELSRIARETVIATITTRASVLESSGVAAAAIALRAALPDAAPVLSDGERHVLGEWLDRLTTSATL